MTAPRTRTRPLGPQLTGVVSGVVLSVGCWLVLQSGNADYGTVSGFDAPWNDRIAGVLAVGLGVARASRRVTLTVATSAGLALGCWLLLSPLMVDYGFGVDSFQATGTTVLAGALVAGLSVVDHLRETDR
ncbi:hypothetical protein JOD54_004252 [Actinokineospora baliensis]|uniref:SPW repeat domain-containing protein n=1 Tax=Actinokineospora baliensis TaxID=547056 RepID=UPI00195C0643|nr:hypothetical protein [Actinokineospora baliensis]MBM7774048.1 hypothetical protein [Actinokineospora baliensis]